MQRLRRSAVEQLMDGRPDATLEAALEVFEVFASGSLTDEVYILDDGGGQWLLRGVPHAVRVRIIAPFEHRVKQWIKRTAEMTGETPNQRAAAELVRRDDLEKSGRMRYLYEVDIADPNLYEMLVNTEKLKHDAVVAVIEGLVRRPEMATADVGRKMVSSRALASRVQVALATHPA